MSRKIRIVFIIWCYSNGGGAEALLTSIVNNLDHDKYDISIAELIHYGTKAEPTDSRVHVLPYITGRYDEDRRDKMFQIIHEPWKIFDKYIGDGYDIYVSFNYQRPSFLLQPKKKNIAWIHGDVFDLLEAKSFEERVFQDAAFFKCNRIVPISDVTEKSIRVVFPRHEEKIHKIYNGLDIERVRRQATETTDVSVEPESVCFVGRLEDNKNPIRAFNLFRKLHGIRPESHLYYMGEGDLREELEKLIKNYCLEHYVHVLGFLENPYPVIRQCDAMIQASKSEGFGLAVLEGLALDVPFVSTDVGASRMMSYDGKCGVIYDTDEEAVEGLNEIMKGACSKYCKPSVERFSLEKYIQEIDELFEELYNEQ